MAICDVAAALAFAAAVYLVAQAWIALPDSIPAHFNARGEPDRWDGKMSLLFGPAISFSSILLLAILSRFPNGDERIRSDENRRGEAAVPVRDVDETWM